MLKKLEKIVLSTALALGIATAPTQAQAWTPIPYRAHFQKYLRTEPDAIVRQGSKVKRVKAASISEFKKDQLVRQYLFMDDGGTTTTCEASRREYPKSSPKPAPRVRVFGRGHDGGPSPTTGKVVTTWNVDCYQDTNNDSRPEREFHGVVYDSETPVRRLNRGWHPVSNYKFRPVKHFTFNGTSSERAAARKKYSKDFPKKGYSALNAGEHHYIIPYQIIRLSTKNHRKL